MNLAPKIQSILERVFVGDSLTIDDMVCLLEFGPNTFEGGIIRAAGYRASQSRASHRAMIYGVCPLEADVRSGTPLFYRSESRRNDTTTAIRSRLLPIDVICRHARDMSRWSDLHTLVFAAPSHIPFDFVLEAVASIRESLHPVTRVAITIGPIDQFMATDLKGARADSVFVLSEDNETILKTLTSLEAAQLDWNYCIPPICIRDSNAQIARRLMFGIDNLCNMMLMPRALRDPNESSSHRGRVSQLRMAQIVAVAAMAAYPRSEVIGLCVHTPNQISLSSGANVVLASHPSLGSGLEMRAARRLLLETGFGEIIRGDSRWTALRSDSPVGATAEE